MSPGQLEHFRKILLAWKRELMEEVDRTMLHMKDDAANFPDPNDRATQETIVTVRDDWQVLSNGRLVGTKANGDGTHTVTLRWVGPNGQELWNSQGDLRVFFGNLLVGGITTLGLVLLLWPLLAAFRFGSRRPRSASAGRIALSCFPAGSAGSTRPPAPRKTSPSAGSSPTLRWKSRTAFIVMPPTRPRHLWPRRSTRPTSSSWPAR